MKVQLEELSSTRRRLEVEVPPERVREVLEGIYKELRQKAVLRGFRKGRAPLSLVKALYKDWIQKEATSRLIEQTLPEVLKQEALEPVVYPEVRPGSLKEEAPFVYTALVEVRPEVKLNRYKGFVLQVKRPKELSEEDVQREIERMREYMAQIKPLEEQREIREGDWVLLDFEAYKDGKLVEGGKVENHLVEVGSGRMVPGFEEALIGMTSGQEKEFQLKMPEDHPRKDLAGQELTFRVKVKELKQKVLPTLGDEFAKEMGFQGVEELKQKVREDLKKRFEEEYQGLLRQKALETLLEENPVEVPESLVRLRAGELFERIRVRVGGIPEEKVKEVFGQCLSIAERELKVAYLVEEIAKLEGIEVREEEVEAQLEASGVPEAMRSSPSLRAQVKGDLLRQKVFDLIIRESEVVHED